MAGTVYAKYNAWVTESIMLIQGEAWNADDPFVRENPQHFTDNEDRPIRGSGRSVEAATAAPGERRTTRAPRTTASDS